MNEALCLLDIRGLLLRQFHSANADWKYGFQNFLERDLEDALSIFPPRRILACWDAGNTYRTLLYPAYKQARREKEKDPAEQEAMKHLFDTAKRTLAYLGVKNVSVPGEEADDLIALFCERVPGKKVVWTIDADLLQLVSEHTDTVVRLKDSVYSSPQQLHNGVPVRFTSLHKSIVGDTSDGYPGVNGVGPAGWSKLVELVGEDGLEELETLVEAKDRATLAGAVSASDDKILKRLLDDWAGWTKSYTLASLHPERCHTVSANKIIRPEWMVRVPDKAKLSAELHKAGALDMLDRLEKWLPTERLIDNETVSSLTHIQAEMLNSPILSWDFESYDVNQFPNLRLAAKRKDFVDVLSQSVTGLSVNYGSNLQHTFYLPVNHADTNNVGRDWAAYLLRVIACREFSVVQNANFELTLCQTDLGLAEDDLGVVHDTAILASYVDENEETHLKAMSLKWFNYKQATYRETVGERNMNEVPAIEVVSYGCDDSLMTSHLYDLFRLIMQVEGSWDFYVANEVEHVKDSVRTFIDGCPIDTELAAAFLVEDKQVIDDSDKKIRSALEQHLPGREDSEVMAAATSLYDIRKELLEHTFKGTKEELQAKLDLLWSRVWEECFYEHKIETKELPKFSVTPAKLNDLTRRLGYPDIRFEKGLSSNQISGWLDEIEELTAESTRNYELLKKLADAVMILATEAASLQKRPSDTGYGSFSGKDVERLANYPALKSLADQIYMETGAGKGKVVGNLLDYASPKQMQGLLYGKLGLPLRRRSKKLKGSTRDKLGLPGAAATGGKAAAAAIVYDTPETDWRRDVLLAYKEIVARQQNISLFLNPYPLWVYPTDGKIHPQIRNCGTVTRRPSGTSPNVLQVSKKEGAKIRNLYLPYSDEYIHVSVDFKQQEVLVTACESRDHVMMDAIKNDFDIHSVTSTGFADILANRAGYSVGPMSYDQFLAFKEVDPSLHKTIRNAAKAVLFLTFYGGGAGTLAENLLIEKPLAERMLNGLFSTYPRLLPWQQEVIQFAEQHGYVETIYGTRRHLNTDLFSDEQGLRSRQQRQAINYLIQGGCADILKLVLTDIRRRRMVERYKLKGLKPVYDEISVMVPLDAASDYVAEITEVMTITPPGYPLTLATDVSVGLRWGGVQEINDVSQKAIEDVIGKQKAEGYLC